MTDSTNLRLETRLPESKAQIIELGQKETTIESQNQTTQEKCARLEEEYDDLLYEVEQHGNQLAQTYRETMNQENLVVDSLRDTLDVIPNNVF